MSFMAPTSSGPTSEYYRSTRRKKLVKNEQCSDRLTRVYQLTRERHDTDLAQYRAPSYLTSDPSRVGSAARRSILLSNAKREARYSRWITLCTVEKPPDYPAAELL